MKFAIDVVYLDRKKGVRKVRKEMVPWRMSACLTAHSVLELPVGVIESAAPSRAISSNLKSGVIVNQCK